VTKVCSDDLCGDERPTETVFGWSRHTVAKGLNEYQIGKIIENQPRAGKSKTEGKNLQLVNDICDHMEQSSQTGTNFQSLFKDTRMTAKAVHQAMIEEKGSTDEELLSENTIGMMLNRMNDKLRPVEKTKPENKIKKTDAIFDNVYRINAESDAREDCLRISMDTKAILKPGELSRRGQSRGQEAVKAQDKDLNVKEKFVPLGRLEVVSGVLTLLFGTSHVKPVISSSIVLRIGGRTGRINILISANW